MKQNKNIHKWFFLGVMSILLGGPNATVVRYGVGDFDPTLFSVLRFGSVALCLAPYLFMKRKSINKKSLYYSLLMGVFMTIAVVSFVWAIKLSQASYVSILTLVMPIIFIFYAMKFDKQRVSRRSFLGITLAAAGAFTIVALPIMLHQQAAFVFYPAATALALLNVLTFPLTIIFSKKAHQAGMPIMATLGISSWVVVLLSAALVPLTYTGVLFALPPGGAIFAILYSGLIVALLSRVLGIASYERIGPVASGALAYAETLLAVLLPVFILGEQLSREMVLGGVLILLGVYVVEHHKSPHHKHAHILRHH